MYRKNLMRVCLAAIMTATVMTTSVPVYAAEAPAKQGTENKKQTAVVRLLDGRKQVALTSVEYEGNSFNTSALVETAKKLGYEVTLLGDIPVPETGVVDVAVKKIVEEKPETPEKPEKPEKPEAPEATEKRTVIVRFLEGRKEVGLTTIEIEGNSFNTSLVKEAAAKLGYTINLGGDIQVGKDGIAELEVTKIKEEKPEKPEKQTVIVRFLEGRKEVGLTTIEIEGNIFNTSLVKEAVAKLGYEIAVVGDIKAVDGIAEVSVRKVVAENRNVWVKFETEDGKLLDDATIVKIGKDDTYFHTSKIKTPEGYELCEAGDVYVGNADAVTVKVRKAVRKTVLHLTFETKYGEVVGKDTVFTTAQGAHGEAWTFMLGTDFNLPEGWKLAEGVDQAQNIEIPFGAVGGHTMIVEPVLPEQKETKLTVTFETVDGKVVGTTEASTKAQGADGEAWTFMLGTDFFLPEGYKLAEGVDQVQNIEVPFGAVGGHTMLVEKIEVVDPETPEKPETPVKPEKPETPVKPEKPQVEDKEDKKDKDDKKNPKTSDEASPLAMATTAGLSLAAILALLKKMK